VVLLLRGKGREGRGKEGRKEGREKWREWERGREDDGR